MWVLWCTVCFSVARAQSSGDTAQVLDRARTQIETLQREMKADLADERLAALRAEALALQTSIAGLSAELSPMLVSVEERLAGLGPTPEGGTEAADVAEQRTALDRARNLLDAQLKLARLLAVESEQAADAVSTLRRTRFEAQIGERTASVLAPAFWIELRVGVLRDRSRVAQLGREIGAAATATPPVVWLAGSAVVLALALLRHWGARRLLGYAAQRLPQGRLRRSLPALVSALLATAVPTLAAQALRLSLSWERPPSAVLETLLVTMVGVVGFGAFIAGLGRALLSARRPSWRLPPLTDGVAHGLRKYPLALGVVLVVGALADRLAGLLNSNLATAVAVNCLSALALGAVLALGLRRAVRLHRRTFETNDGRVAPSAAGGWLSLLGFVVSLALGFSFLCLLTGYVALGALIVRQLLWAATIFASTYLLAAVVDDLFKALSTPSGAAEIRTAGAGTAAAALEPVSPSTQAWRRQLAVALSGLCRMLLMLLALMLLAAPFGRGPGELMERAGQLVADGLRIGEIVVSPSAVFKAIAVFGVGVVCIRWLQRWLAEQLLPTTAMDVGMRTSATTLLGYVGFVLAAAFGLSAAGLGLERVAWVASALSVGIGFGLQAVVSNFVSGLILLAERPVKVGDWVSLGGIEGDIRRINVRATEIQMGDKSTVIVPNSEFITKTVRNITHANPQGLVQIKLPMPLESDVLQVRALLMAAFAEHPEVLETPPPAVFMDTIEAGGLVFNATGTVASPRQAYGVKSDLLFDILARLRTAGLPLARVSTMLLQPGNGPATEGSPAESPPADRQSDAGSGVSGPAPPPKPAT